MKCSGVVAELSMMCGWLLFEFRFVVVLCGEMTQEYKLSQTEKLLKICRIAMQDTVC